MPQVVLALARKILKRGFVLAATCTVAIALSGCGGAGGGSSNALPPSNPAAPPAAPAHTASPGPSPTGTASPPAPNAPGPTPTPSPVAMQGNLLYVALGGNQTQENSVIEAFALNSGGNISPVKTITQHQNDMPSPVTIAFDARGNLYVANVPYPGLSGSKDFIDVFAPGANGSAVPIRTIGAPVQNSTLGQAVIEALAIDAAGYLYVAQDTSTEDCTSTPTCTATNNDTILVFAPNANGNVAPIRSIDSSACFEIGGMAVMPTGELIAACMPVSPSGSLQPYSRLRPETLAEYLGRRVESSQDAAPEIETFAPGASGNATPINVVTGSNTQLSGAGSVALSPLGSIVVLPRAVQTGQVVTFPQSATGNAAPTTDITGSSTQLTGNGAVTVDAAGNIYVLNTQFGGNPPASITEYSSNANGNAAPINVISGSNTGVNVGMWGIAIGPP